GLRYSILKQASDGRAAEVDPDRVFQSGDRIRLSIEANDTAHLYIVQRGSSGNWSLLFPSPEISGGENLIERGKHYEIPAGHWFAFDEQPGTEKLFVVLSRGPQPDLEKMIYALREGETKPSKTLLAENTRSIDDAVVGRIRSQVAARDLIFEKVGENIGDQKEKAVYVVNKSGGSGSSVIADVSLNHK
ncbi:MAG TPA: DUF4384 domain-containing protein, partial [Bryobacterales bacterium]|nr:DUF4384 domain-containing protein [Bryobacterales bacterium]